MSVRLASRTAVLFGALACAGCAATAPSSPPAPTASDTAALEAAYWSTVEASRTRFTEADVHFMTGMIGHHAQALVMSAMAPTHGASPDVLRLAARIDNAQRDEIATMQRWLRDRGQPVPEVNPDGTVPMDHSTMDHSTMDHGTMDHGAMSGGHTMPGMLTARQLADLDAARGATFDRLFLTYMIQHHGGAVVMVEELFATDGAGLDEEAFKVATDVQVDQRTEIARMQSMLDARTASTEPR